MKPQTTPPPKNPYISSLTSFYFRDKTFSTLISFYYHDVTLLTSISFDCCDQTFSTLLSFYCRDETFADPIDLVSPKVGKIIPALFRLPAGNLPDDRVCRVERVCYSSVICMYCRKKGIWCDSVRFMPAQGDGGIACAIDFVKWKPFQIFSMSSSR